MATMLHSLSTATLTLALFGIPSGSDREIGVIPFSPPELDPYIGTYQSAPGTVGANRLTLILGPGHQAALVSEAGARAAQTAPASPGPSGAMPGMISTGSTARSQNGTWLVGTGASAGLIRIHFDRASNRAQPTQPELAPASIDVSVQATGCTLQVTADAQATLGAGGTTLTKSGCK